MGDRSNSSERKLLDPALAQQLRAARRSAGIGLRTLEQRSGLSRGFLSLVERGKRCPSVETIERLVAVFDLPADLIEGLLVAARSEPQRAKRGARSSSMENVGGRDRKPSRESKLGDPRIYHPAAPTCRAHTSSGRRCSRAPVRGSVVCHMHGGRARQVKAAAVKRAEEARAISIIERYGIPAEQSNPFAVLLHSVWLADHLERFFAERVRELGDMAKLIDSDPVSGKMPHVYVRLHKEWSDRAAKYARLCLDADVDERHIGLAERQSEWLAKSIRDGLDKAGCSAPEKAKIIDAIATAMRLNHPGTSA